FHGVAGDQLGILGRKFGDKIGRRSVRWASGIARPMTSIPKTSGLGPPPCKTFPHKASLAGGASGGKKAFGNRRGADGDSGFPGELPEFALCSGHFVRLQPPRTEKGDSYGRRGGFAAAGDEAKEQDDDEGQRSVQWTMRRHADVHEDVRERLEHACGST